MFLRRDKITGLKRLRELVWPSAGWRRTSSYLFHRVARLPGSPYFLAAGFACGAAISFTPMVGLHIVLSCLLAWVLRASLLAAAIGTVIGNPWTFPFIWIWTYELGRWFLNLESSGVSSQHVNFSRMFGHVTAAFLRLDIRFLFETAWPVLAPMLVGSIPTAIFVWFVSYFTLRPMVAAYQVRRLARRERKTREEAKAPEGAHDEAA